MSKARQKTTSTIYTPVKADVKKESTVIATSTNNKGFTIRNPLLWLIAASILMYLPSLNFGFTELDDSIFIREFGSYYDNANFFTAFGRGLFNATKDPYYRPIFLNAMFMNYKVSGEEIFGYHLLNICFHALTVFLLYKLFLKLKIAEINALFLSALFAVHPVLTQAVAWIPGRNDTMLAIFTLSFFIHTINYSLEGKKQSLILASLFLLLAFFTKETALFAAPAAFVLLAFVLQQPWKQKQNLILYGTWLGCAVLWFVARYAATIHLSTTLAIGQQATEFIQRTPLIIQYIGKIFLPFNLSVFPIQKDTVIYFGLAATGILIALLYFSKNPNWMAVTGGMLFFLLFLLPALLVPSNLNEQTFEHRLYLPVIGILIIVNESAWFKNASKQLLLYSVVGVCIAFAALNYLHQQNFESPQKFWRQAAKTSPNSAYALMMLGAREDNLPLSYALFRKAYQLNPSEKYLNYYYGKMLQLQDSIMASEKYFLKEKNSSGYYECDFYLARVAMEKRDTTAAITYLQTYLKADPPNPPANNNLLLMLMAKNDLNSARLHVAHMKTVGLPVPPDILQKLGM